MLVYLAHTAGNFRLALAEAFPAYIYTMHRYLVRIKQQIREFYIGFSFPIVELQEGALALQQNHVQIFVSLQINNRKRLRHLSSAQEFFFFPLLVLRRMTVHVCLLGQWIRQVLHQACFVYKGS